MNATENLDLLNRLKALDAKYRRACDALEYVAFADPEIWNQRDRMIRAKNTLAELGEIMRIPCEVCGTHDPAVVAACYDGACPKLNQGYRRE